MTVRFLEAGTTAAQAGLVTLEQWLATRGDGTASVAGVIVPNDQDIEQIEADLPRIGIVVLQFPKWVDGRAYSHARILRRRYRYAGEIRATGDVVVDMLPLLKRTGFDAVELRADQRRDIAERALGFFPSFYQGDVEQTQPLFARTS